MQAQQNVAQAPAFALTPGSVDTANIIDYSTSMGKKLWDEATGTLEYLYDVSAEGGLLFSEKIHDRATAAGWSAINADILTIPDPDGNNKYLVTNYGELTLQEVDAHAQTYASQQSRQAQNAVQMYHCIMKSLTPEGHQRIIAEREEYLVKIVDPNNNQVSKFVNGPKLYKFILSKAMVDTQATTSHYSENLMSLDTYMPTVDSDIIEFNKYVRINRQGLRSFGRTPSDLMVSLFKGYFMASDREFVSYMRSLKNNYDDGSRPLTADLLMTLAQNKYVDLKRDNEWNRLSPEQEQIVALNATVDKIKDTNLQLSRQLSNRNRTRTGGTGSTTGNSGGQQSNSSGGSNRSSSRNQNNRSRRGTRRQSFKSQQNQAYAWKKEKPKANHPKKTVNGKSYFFLEKDDKVYYWCEYHEAWVLHLPEDEGENGCKLRKQLQQEGSRNSSQSTSNRAFQSALTTIMTQLEEDEDEE